MGERILIISHGHPDFILGGAEIAAFNLFKAYQECPSVDQVWLLARADLGNGLTGKIHSYRSNEFLWEQGSVSWSLQSANLSSVTNEFVELIRKLNPTIVHAHHFVHLGIEIFRAIKDTNPRTKVILTLHEYIAICANNGQMIKTNGSLCYKSSSIECSHCFPSNSPEDFQMRQSHIKEYFQFIDAFVSPSEFLRERYIDWGIPAEQIVVIENGQSDVEKLAPRRLAKGETRNRFGFFGQINRFKGLQVVLNAIGRMSEAERNKFTLEINGTNLDKQSGQFKAEIESLLGNLSGSSCLQWVGPYKPEELKDRLARVDWVIVPSIWWENSPMVIQEAFSYGRPVIVSDLGGMSEKVRDGIDGYKVLAGDEKAWTSVILEASSANELWIDLYEGITKPLTHQQCAQTHLEFFSKLDSLTIPTEAQSK